PARWLGWRRTAASLLENFHRFRRDPPLRASRQVGGNIDPDQFTASEKRTDLIGADAPAVAEIGDRKASLRQTTANGRPGHGHNGLSGHGIPPGHHVVVWAASKVALISGTYSSGMSRRPPTMGHRLPSNFRW